MLREKMELLRGIMPLPDNIYEKLMLKNPDMKPQETINHAVLGKNSKVN